MKISVFINDKLVPRSEVEAWEHKRILHVSEFLQKELDLPSLDITKNNDGSNRTHEEMRLALLKIKMDAGETSLRKVVQNQIDNFHSDINIADVLSSGESKFCIIEMLVEDGCSAEEMYRKYFKLMLENNTQNDELNRGANPDHYISKGLEGRIQEVMETTGGAPIPTRFFLHYGVREGMKIPKDDSYTYEIAGVGKTESGVVAGGAVHLIRDEGTGFRMKLQIEFPSIYLDSMVAEHQLHLACEFSNWFTAIVNDPNY